MKAIYEAFGPWGTAATAAGILVLIIMAVRPLRPIAADWLRISWTWLLGVLARYRPIALAIFSAAASATASLAFQGTEPKQWWGLTVVLVFLIVLAGLTPPRYAIADLVSFMLPAVHRVLQLTDAERVTIHLLVSGRREKYEQLTEYFPREDTIKRGRVFPFSHGIVGHVFKTRQPLCWSVLEVVSEKELQDKPAESWRKAMNRRWEFSEPELARLTPDRHSFLAYPIGQEGPHARAVLFIDSKDPKRFHGDKGEPYDELIKTIFLPELREALRTV